MATLNELQRNIGEGTRLSADQFESMVRETKRRAYSMALQLTRNASDAEDLVQETYVKAWKGFDSYMPGRPFLNWLLRIMQRAYLDSRRRENPIRKAESIHAMVSPSDGDLQDMPIVDPQSNPAEDVIRSEYSDEVRACLAELPEVYRAVLILCDIEGRSYGEIAEIQRTTIGTVRSRIHRGRKLLRAGLMKRSISAP
ncbi:MAG TPA: sigma-70 family RNA polymerase sigma factor [Fimbriimonadaceae bacterium]|nr:sigma-70 family RNA polymerase sigma factor [Fimbriimonadaceae bacterium]HRJ32606.1 sigma-70 family RNA polymerase sigma factor [Fimbriimonadaceae bacterium]